MRLSSSSKIESTSARQVEITPSVISLVVSILISYLLGIDSDSWGLNCTYYSPASAFNQVSCNWRISSPYPVSNRTSDFITHLSCLRVIQLWNIVSSSEHLFRQLATALSSNHNLRELFLTAFPFKLGCPQDTSDAVYDALRDHSALRKIMVRPHCNTTAFVDACANWRNLEFIFIEVATDEVWV